jgi:hypothetical protein
MMSSLSRDLHNFTRFFPLIPYLHILLVLTRSSTLLSAVMTRCFSNALEEFTFLRYPPSTWAHLLVFLGASQPNTGFNSCNS